MTRIKKLTDDSNTLRVECCICQAVLRRKKAILSLKHCVVEKCGKEESTIDWPAEKWIRLVTAHAFQTFEVGRQKNNFS